MPYVLEKRDDKWCVKSTTSGKTHGCHDSRAGAIKQQRALYANAPESAEEDVNMMIVTTTGTDLSAAPTDWPMTIATISNTAESSVALAKEPTREPWSGILGTEWSPTDDGRLLERDRISHRDLPVPFSVQVQRAEQHDGSFVCGRIESISRIPIEEFAKRPDANQFSLDHIRPGAIVLYGEGTLDGSEYADHAKRLLENGNGVSLDGLRYSGKLYAREDLSEIEADEGDFGMFLELAMGEGSLRGINGDISGVTVVDTPAFKEAKVMVASAQLRFHDPEVVPLSGNSAWSPNVMVAAAAPVKAPSAWFKDPELRELTPLTITKEGRVYGHLADWDGCHVGMQGICVPPFRSTTDYAYFNVGAYETAEGEEVSIGKIMFSMSGAGHAPVHMAYMDAQRYYDDSTKVAAFVHAGADQHGTWLAGALRPGLSELEVQHIRAHPPSGDWRPIRPTDFNSELIAGLCVPVGGFPIPRRQALVASADGEITAIITAPLQIPNAVGARRIRRQREVLARELREIFGPRIGTPSRIRQEVLAARKGE